MLAKHEIRNYIGNETVWIGKYKNSHNLLHYHQDCELLYVVDGDIDVFCEKNTYNLKKDDALFVDSGQVHYMSANDPETILIVIIFSYGIIKHFASDLILKSPVLSKKYDILNLYDNLMKELQAKNLFYASATANIVESKMIEIFRNEETEERHKNKASNQAFKDLLDKINQEYSTITFEDAYSFMSMSDAYFSRFFKRITGMTFSQYLNYVKIEKAIDLLKSEDITMTELSEVCGFGTIRNFNRIFKSITGYTPSKIPVEYVLDDKFFYSGSDFNPTLNDCELIEEAK